MLGCVAMMSGWHDTRASWTATDPSGAVAVTVNARGVVERVDLDAGWVHVVGPSGLGEAVMWAYAAAAAEVVPAPSPPTADRLPAAESDDVPTAGRQRSIAELDAQVRRAWQNLRQASDRLAAAVAAKSITGSNTLLRLDLDRGRVTGMKVVDRRRATLADPNRLAADAWELLRTMAPDPDGTEGVGHG